LPRGRTEGPAKTAAAAKGERIYWLWTQKEAYTKLLGCGHFMEFSSIECLAGSAHLKHGPGLNSAIHLENFYLPVDHCLYHASLAIDKSRSNPGPIDLQLISLGDPGGSIDAGPQ